MTAIELQEWLQAHAEPQLATFNHGLIPHCPRHIWGVRTPLLRRLAKELKKNEEPIPEMGDSHEEMLLRVFLLGEERIPFSQLLQRVTALLPEVNTWAICDALCSVLKAFKRYDSEGFEFIHPYLSSTQPYEQRFAVVMLLSHYVRSSYIDRILEIYIHIEPMDYYVKMAVAWGLATCYAKYPLKVEDALRHARLHLDVRQMAVQKILESRHTDMEQRQRILRLRNR